MPKKQITLSFTDYLIEGVAQVTLWGGGAACIKMKPFHLKSANARELLKNLNDAGFGVESIDGAICHISENYEGTTKYKKTVNVGRVDEFTQEYDYAIN